MRASLFPPSTPQRPKRRYWLNTLDLDLTINSWPYLSNKYPISPTLSLRCDHHGNDAAGFQKIHMIPLLGVGNLTQKFKRKPKKIEGRSLRQTGLIESEDIYILWVSLSEKGKQRIGSPIQDLPSSLKFCLISRPNVGMTHPRRSGRGGGENRIPKWAAPGRPYVGRSRGVVTRQQATEKATSCEQRNRQT